MSLIDKATRERMEAAADRLGLSSAKSFAADLAENLLQRFPELQTARATSLKEAVSIALPALKAVAIAAIAALVIRVIGAAALALGIKVLLGLAVVCLALYLICRVAPGVQLKLQEIFAPVNDAFRVGGTLNKTKLARGATLVAAKYQRGDAMLA